GAERARRSRDPVRVALGEIGREGERRGPVEGRREVRRRQRRRSSHAERGEQERQRHEQPRPPVQPAVDGALKRAPTRPTTLPGWADGRHGTAIVGRREYGRQAADSMPEPATILLVDDEDAVQKLLAYPLEHEG